MPELPEVETIVQGLKVPLCNRKINNVFVRDKRIVGYPDNLKKFKTKLEGYKIISLGRRGKYIIIEISSGKLLIIHLRMTGQLLIKNRLEEIAKHTHIILQLDNSTDLRFNNVRKFGRMYLVDPDKPEQAGGFANLGPEPLTEEFTAEKLKEIIKGRSTSIKNILLNQQLIAGIGNIYCDEALFRSGIRPDRPVDKLSDQEIEKLHHEINNVIAAGIKFNGTTFSDYVNAMGEEGSFQEELMVYNRSGENCQHCDCHIEKNKVAGRSSHFCPNCQN